MQKLVTRCVSVLVLLCSLCLVHGPTPVCAYELEADFAIITVNPAALPGHATNRLGEAVSAVPTAWDWTSGNLLGWSGSGISGLAATGGSITGTGTTASPFIQITGFSGPDLDFGYYDYLQLRLRLPSGFGGDVIFRFGTSTDGGNTSADREFRIPNARLVNDGQWHTYRVDLGLIPRYRDQLTDLRVYPLGNQGNGATFEIDYVEIGDKPGDFLWINTNINKLDSVPEADVRHQSSKHATIWWEEGSGITAEHTRRALRMIEESHQVFAKILGYKEPFESWELWRRDGKRYKVNHVTWFSGYWMGGRAGFGYFNVPSGGLRNEARGNPVPHEYGHVVQGHQINFLVGGHWESHANYLRQAWVMHHAWRMQAGQKADLSMMPLINSNFRQDHGRLIYHDYRIHHAIEQLTEIGLDPKLPARLWYEGQKDRTCYLELADRLPAGRSVPDVVARGLRRWPFLDFEQAALFRDQLWRTANDKAWHDYLTGSLLIPSQDRPGWWRVPFARAPERFAYMYHELDATSSSVTVELQGIDVMGTTEGWRWSLAAMDGAGNMRYSDVFTPGTRTMSLQAGETKVYLIVVATPTNNSLNLEWTDNRLPTDRHPDRLRYPYEVRLVGATPAKRQLNWNTTAGSTHPNGGGWKANTATVHSTAYVGPNARVLGSAQVLGQARIEDYAVVAENAIVRDNAVVSGYAVVRGSARVNNNARVRDRAAVTGSVQVLDQSLITEYANPSGSLTVRENAIVRGQASSWAGNISGHAILDYDCSTGASYDNGVQFNHVPWGDWYEDYWRRTKAKPRGLVASYRMEEPEGRMVWDEFGVAHALLRGNGQRVFDGVRRTQVMRLDGSSAYLVLDRNLCALRSATYSLWVKPSGANTDRAVLFMGGASNRFLRIVPRDGDGRARVRIASGATATEWLSQSEIPQNVWTHLAITLDADTGQGVLYVNGQAQESKTSALRPEQVLGPNDYASGEALYIGRDWAGNHFAGDVVDARFYNVALTARQIEDEIRRSGHALGAFFTDAPQNFDGSSTEVQSGVIDGLERMLTAKVYPRASTANDYYEGIFDSSDERTATLRGSGFGLRNGRIYVRLANVGFWDTGVNATMNQWQTITLTYNGSQAILYINGTQRATRTYTANQSHVAGKNFRIGFAQSAASVDSKYYFNGEIRDAYIYDKLSTTAPEPPAVPGSISYPASSSTGQYTVSWQASAGATDYRLERTSDGGATWQHRYTGSALSFSESVGSGNHRYRVSAQNSHGNSGWRTGGQDCVVLVGSAPAAPTNLVASAASSSQIDLTWNDNSDNETGFKIERKTGSGGTWSQITTTGANATSFSNTGLSASTTYFYRVRATNSVGDSANSNEASATTGVPVPAVPASINYPSSSSTGQYTVSWTASSGATDYRLERSSDGGATWQHRYTGPALSFNESVGSGNHRYRVSAQNSHGNSGWRTGGQDCVVLWAWPGGSGAGSILREWWTGISGTAVSDLTSSADYPDNPSGSDQRNAFEAPINWADNYGTRMRGYIHPPVSGTYTFWIASDDGSELWLSSSSNPAGKVKIAQVDTWTNSREWTKFASQKSAGIALQAGQRYYIEALHKEGGGGDNLAVSWQVGGYPQEVIDGPYLSPFVGGDPKLTGTVIGTTGSYNNLGNTRDKAFDDNTASFFDAPSGNGAWCGLDLGSGVSKQVTKIRFYPRASFAHRMNGGRFQGSNTADFSSGVVTLHTINAAPPDGSWTETVSIGSTAGFRYVRYLSPDGSYGNVAEVEFYGRDGVAASPMNLWRQEQFGVNAGNDAIAGPLADPNQDGVVNLLKFALRGNPHVNDRATILPRWARDAEDGGPVFVFRVRHANGQFANDGYVADGLLYQVHRSSNPGSGEWVLQSFAEENTVWAVDADGTPMLEMKVDGVEPPATRFLRLRVMMMDPEG